MPILCVYPVPLSYVGRRWDIPVTPMCTTTHANPMCLSRPTVLCRTGGISQGLPCVPPHMPILCVYPVPLSYVGHRWDIPGTPLCTTTHANPMCLSRPTVLCRTEVGYPRDSHVYHHTCQSYVSIPSHCPM